MPPDSPWITDPRDWQRADCRFTWKASGPNGSASCPPPLRPAGAKDEAFMSHTYRAYLEGARGFSPVVVLAAAQDYTRVMLADL